ncbi:MAG: hypothetical protein R3E01_00185 [Pirellulaceae bacterium]
MKSIRLQSSRKLQLPSGVLSLSIGHDDRTMVCGCLHGVYLIDGDPNDRQVDHVERLYEHESYVSSIAWLDENHIVSAGYDGTLRWYDVSYRTPLRSVRVHDFWSWDMSVSPDRTLLASVTGQYLAGGYKYEPQPEREPSLQIVSNATGQIVQSFSHLPPVQAVAWSDDGRYVAAGNMMGDVRVYNLHDGRTVADWNTPDFTSWGIIKSHSYLGGIFAMRFTPDGEHLLLAGMGPMRDPMAGNGKQLWQRWHWNGEKPELSDQTHKDEAGEGLMETLAIHPSGEYFVMGGRLRGGQWNIALFDLASGAKIIDAKTDFRATEAAFTADGKQLVVAGCDGQDKRDDQGNFQPFGRVIVYDISS